MTFIYTKPKCESGKLIKTRCECKIKTVKKITVKKKTLKRKKSSRNKTVKKAPKKVKKSSVKLQKKYREDWAMIPENYLLKTPSVKQLETRRRRIDSVYDIHKSIKKYNKTALSPKKWQYPPEFSSASSLLGTIKDMKRELKYLEKQKRDKSKMKKIIKFTVKQKHANVPKNITVKKKRRKRCPNGMRRDPKTGECVKSSKRVQPEKSIKKSKTVEKNETKSHIVIPSINPSISHNIEKSVAKTRRMKSYTPDVDHELKSLHTYTPEKGLFGCKEREISLMHDGKRICVKWDSDKGQTIMLYNLNTKKGIDCNKIVAPKQHLSNCWFNCFFMVFFISEKGRKFTRYLRQIMITGKRLDGTKVLKKLQWPFFLLNKCIESSLRPGPNNYAYLMDTNNIIEAIYNNLPKKLKDTKKRGLAVRPDMNYNPMSFYSGLINYLDYKNTTKHKHRLNLLEFFTDGYPEEILNNQKHFLTALQEKVKIQPNIPEIIMIEYRDNESRSTVKPKKFSVNINGESKKYVLDSAVLRNTKKYHFSAYITCNNKEYGFDGASHSRIQPFNWKSKINNENIMHWRFADQHDIWFNFTLGYQMLFYYLQ